MSVATRLRELLAQPNLFVEPGPTTPLAHASLLRQDFLPCT